ncbi:MAG: HPr family phosphocarrier protein [Phycisphaerae bacterium]
MPVEREVTVRNREGLHFRPIMQLVETAARFDAAVTLHGAERQADARSPMELLMLVATQGSRLRLVAEGQDAQRVVDALAALFEAGFSEN